MIISGEIVESVDHEELSFHQKLELLLKWGQLCPSAPHKLQCSIGEADYFTINKLPNFFIAGGSTHMECSAYNGCTVVSVPDDHKTKTFIMYDASTNEFSLVDL